MKNRPSIKSSNVLVTGGAGFIGSHLADRILDLGANELIIVDSLFNGSEDNIEGAISKGAIFYKDDIENMSSLDFIFDRHQIDIVFNCATKALNYSFLNPKNAFETNTKVIINLLEHQRKKSFKTLVHFSSSEVYGTAVYEPMDEEHPIKPTTTYAAGKAAADNALQSWVNMFELDSFIVRPFNNYGPRQNYKGFLAGIIPITAWRICNNLPPEIHGSGDQTRDFIFVNDTIDAVIKLFPLLKPSESINISADGQISMNQVIKKIKKFFSYDGKTLIKPSRGADVVTHNACNKKIKSYIEYDLTSFDSGLEKTLQWYKNKIHNK